jgi:alpha-1,2-mannosyltransferase
MWGRVRWVALFGARIAMLAMLTVSVTGGRVRFPAYRLDLDVYRLGSTVLLHGGTLYGTLPLTQNGLRLPFTYPPFAAIALAPLALPPLWLATLVMTAVTVILLAVVLRTLGLARLPLFGALLSAVALEPVRTTVQYGQVDVLLMALVVLDVLVDSPRWPRGLLIGIAAALKLTPAVFVLYFLLRKDYRSAITAGITFCVATGIGFLCATTDSVRYWTHLVFDDTRIGDPGYAGNQSWLGVLTRFSVPTHVRTVLWLVLVAVTIVVAVIGMRRALRARQFTIALGLNAVCGLLISPISWTHHWVWIVVVILGWAALGRRTRRLAPMVVAGASAVLFCLAPQWWLPHNGGVAERAWPLAEQFVGSCYVYFGALLLAAAAMFGHTRPETPPEKVTPPRVAADAG